MKASPTKCDPILLQRSLTEELNELQEEQLAQHLDTCQHCREQLHTLAAGQNEWSKIQAVLKNETTGQHAPAAGPLSTLIPADAPALPTLHSIGMEVETTDFAVDFLTPSKNSSALGQLNNIEIRSIIGRGGNGIVLKGFQEELNRLVAVKVMAPQLATSAAARKRFAREAQATAAIVHPNVMPIITVHSEGQLPYLVMPFVDCESLQDRLDRDGALPVTDILRIAHQVANGLAAAHAQGLVHRDVKPANILLERGVDRVMLTDFGLARAVDDGSLTRTGVIAGTPQYMSPEQARGEAVDTRSDIFSLGSVMYAMCTGRPPFRAETTYGILRRVIEEPPRAIEPLNSEIPSWLSGYVQHLMSKASTDRSVPAAEVADNLTKCIAHVQQPHVNQLPEIVQKFSGIASRGATGRKVLALVFGLALIVLIPALWPTDDAPSPDRVGTSQRLSSGVSPSDDHSATPPESISVEGSDVDDSWNDELDLQLQQLAGDTDALWDSIQEFER